MFCSNCGTKNEEGAKFCVNCGATFEETVENTSNQATEPAEVQETAAVQEAAEAVQETEAVQEAAAVQEPVAAQETPEFVETAPEKKVDVKKIVTVAITLLFAAVFSYFAVSIVKFTKDTKPIWFRIFMWVTACLMILISCLPCVYMIVDLIISFL